MPRPRGARSMSGWTPVALSTRPSVLWKRASGNTSFPNSSAGPVPIAAILSGPDWVSPTGSAGGGHQGGAHDAGVVEQRRRHDRGADVDVAEELVGLLRHPAADDEQVGPQQVLEVVQVLAHPLAPGLPAEVVLLARPARRQLLGVLRIHLDVAQLGVGQQHAVVEHRAADAGAE